MDTASKILIVGGLANIAYGFLNGVWLSKARMSSPIAPKYLNLAHVGALMQGPLVLSLVWAVELSTLPTPIETVSALLLVAGSVVLAGKDTLNWLEGVQDEFVERPLGFYLGAVNAILSSTGLAILIVGVAETLWND